MQRLGEGAGSPAETVLPEADEAAAELAAERS